MLKKFVLALMPLAMLASTVKADDQLTVDATSISDASVEIVLNDLDIDVDALSADAGEENEDGVDAIEACFRRFGYSRRGWGGHYGGYRGYRGYRYNTYSSYYCRPTYCYRPLCYSAPVYNYCAPVYRSYWGCN
jgi:hypothetical protein